LQLPKYKKKKRIKLKVCQEPGCGKEFWGHPIAKYCELHRDIKQRQKQKKELDSIETRNMVFRHNYTEVMEIPFLCCLDGCENEFTIKVFPKQFVYPRFCIAHRNDFKRANFIRMRRRTLRQKSAVAMA
jgi:stress-induced morphogen